MQFEDKLRSYEIKMGVGASVSTLTTCLAAYSVLEYSSNKDPLWLISTVACFLGIACSALMIKESYNYYKWFKELSEPQDKQSKLEEIASE